MITQKKALKQVQEYCNANGLDLIPGSIRRNEYAITFPCNANATNKIIGIDGGYYKRLSGFLTPKELLIWIDGYNAGLQNK